MKEKTILEKFKKDYGSKFIPYPQSLLEKGGQFYFLARGREEKFLVEGDKKFKIFPLNRQTLSHLQRIFPHLHPTPCGRRASFGFGDRLGIATPGHIQALKGYTLFPIFAQQSGRENERTGRSFQEVMDDALWGIFQEGYKGPFGADADHLKTEKDLQEAIEAGFSFFTVDPSEEIIDLSNLNNEQLEKIYSGMENRRSLEKEYLGRKYKIQDITVELEPFSFKKTLVAYGKAIDKVEKLWLVCKDRKKEDFDFEVSIDETKLPTTFMDHIFISEELHRRGINFQSLALRFVGSFQKGVDYRGNIKEFSNHLEIHARIASLLGGYKLSLHSGSDKLSIYPLLKEKTGGLFHVKTSGTSWLEAVRLIGEENPSLFRRMYRLALQKFPQDRLSYHLHTDLSGLKDPSQIPDRELPSLLDKDEIRQLMHVTYGSLLIGFSPQIYRTIFQHEHRYHSLLKTHLGNHLSLIF